MTDSNSTRVTSPTVLIVSPWYRPDIGGIVEIADRLLLRLNQHGIRTLLLVADDLSRELQLDPSMPSVWRLRIPASAFSKPSPRTIAGTLLRGIRTFSRSALS
jgi:hypothetical protein